MCVSGRCVAAVELGGSQSVSDVVGVKIGVGGFARRLKPGRDEKGTEEEQKPFRGHDGIVLRVLSHMRGPCLASRNHFNFGATSAAISSSASMSFTEAWGSR